MTPILRDYKVGLVMPKAGINGAQLSNIGMRLDAISKVLPEDGHIDLFVPGFNLADAEESVARDVRNLLERKGKVRITYLPMGGEHKAGVAQQILYELAGAKRCDEIWCCPAEGQQKNSSARVAQVWRLGQAHTRHACFKQIPPWVELPSPPQNPNAKPTKGKTKSWRDMWNKRSFHW